MDLKRATTLASVTVMTFMLAGGYFVKVGTKFARNLHLLSLDRLQNQTDETAKFVCNYGFLE